MSGQKSVDQSVITQGIPCTDLRSNSNEISSLEISVTQNVKSVTRSNSFFGFQGLEFTKAQVGVLNSKVYCIIVKQLLKLSVCE